MLRGFLRSFTATAVPLNKIKLPPKHKMPPRPKINEDEIEEKFIKGGSGKGGQKINKTNSKVQLLHINTGLVVTSQATRSREQNRKIAREIMALKLQEMENPETSRANILKLKKQQVKQRKTRKSKRKYAGLESDDEPEIDQDEQEFIKKMLIENEVHNKTES